MAMSVGMMLLARFCVPRAGAATTVGLLAGLGAALLGMGKGGPLIVLKLVLPALVIDAAGVLAPVRLLDLRVALGVGALAGATHFAPILLVALAAGLAPRVAVVHALLASGAKAAFGALGAWGAVLIGRRLRDHGLLGAP
jgi:hypothetical protein